jgi:quinol monooxygenase YgiN
MRLISIKVKITNLIATFLFLILVFSGLMISTMEVWADNINELIIVVGQVKVKPQKEHEFIDFSQSLISPSRSEAGAISYSFYKDETQDHSFIFYEEWKNQVALDYHFQTPYFKEFVKMAPDLLAEPAVIKIYRVASSKILN